MKKIIIISLLVINVLIMIFVLAVNADHFYADFVQYGALYFSPHKILNSCMVSYGSWEGEGDSLSVEIPDELDGHRVTIWGDNYPGNFIFNIEGTEYACSEEMLPQDAVIIPRYLTINIGANLKELRDITMKEYYKVGNDSSIFYQIRVEIHCSQDNPYFYSNDGKLYRKSNNQLIDLFFYSSDYQ